MVILVLAILAKMRMIHINGAKYARMDQVKFVEDSLMVCLNRLYHFNFFKGCLAQIILGPFLNTLSQVKIVVNNDVSE